MKDHDRIDVTAMELPFVAVRGAREHNLKNVDVDIPKKKLVVFTGVSGSGKSSMAFDPIFAEGQRRYIESLSSYARQFLGQLEKPKYDTIRGLAPTIAIEQKAASNNPRSTVGTITEVYDYLRVLYARVGTQHCHKCGKKVGRGDAASMVEQIMQLAPGSKILVMAPIIEGRKGEHRDVLEKLRAEGYQRVRVDGVVSSIDDVQSLAKHKKHTIETVVERLVVKHTAQSRARLTDAVETTLKLGSGRMIVHDSGPQRDIAMSEERSCCGHAFAALEPPLFSFNAPAGMCQACNGLGSALTMDEGKIVPDKSLSLNEGAIVPWRGYFVNGLDTLREGSWSLEQFRAMERQWGVDFDTPWQKLPAKIRRWILYGSQGGVLKVNWKSARMEGSWETEFEGLIPEMTRRYLKTGSEMAKAWYAQFMSTMPCPACQGMRLRPEVCAVKIEKRSIVELCAMSVREAFAFLDSLHLSTGQTMVAKELLKEIKARLSFLINVGLEYLTLDRKGPSLSGGEAQRIRLASQIGSELTGVLYILDEPSIGLHQKDNLKLLNTLRYLRDLGNTLIVVEHDHETIATADWVVDFGPRAGAEGGEVVAQGTPAAIMREPKSITGRFLSGKERIATPSQRRRPDKNRAIRLKGVSENNLRNIDVSIPLGLFVAVTGVSGAGKSSLINQVLYPALSRKLGGEQVDEGRYAKIEGLEHIDKVIDIDQRPIGRTPRSNPATYTKVFDLIRDFFAELPESRTRGYKPGRFSFNVRGGRCEHCGGDGYITVEMHFLADVLVPCEVCGAKRFNEATLQIRYKTYNIADVLDLSVADARKLFDRHPRIRQIMDTLIEVGLSYIKLGQPATTLSGGEAQRIKLARELAKRSTGRTLYILDEPTTGLHFDDIRKLLAVLQTLVDGGNTIVVIEHNLDVIKCADWVIDLGPDGGDKGGLLIAEGTPEDVARVGDSYTGQFLKTCLMI